MIRVIIILLVSEKDRRGRERNGIRMINSNEGNDNWGLRLKYSSKWNRDKVLCTQDEVESGPTLSVDLPETGNEDPHSEECCQVCV